MIARAVPALIDIHAHVLPGIDDGPPDLPAAVAMVRAAADAGIGTLAATPHLRADFPEVHIDELSERLEAVRRAVGEVAPAITLVGGAEVSLAWALIAGDEQLRLASFGQRGQDLLIETPSRIVYGFERMLEQLRDRGLRITLAHPERTPELQRHPERLREIAAQGVLLQVNAESLLGDGRSSGVRRLARWLCTEGLAHALASDAHRGHGWRPVTRLAGGAEMLRELVGPERASWMTSAAPAAILAGAPLPPPPEVTLPGRRRLLRLGRR